ncbi:MAG TPA: protein-methionine-sulfoxide reductase heme-binding subunit MsrQ [Gemmatimonadaceae bacterium]|nr:protein-methionine-sulfoxide reductase heme-binding subunit MsrQ [Gemmatimonadaceae bacterium]
MNPDQVLRGPARRKPVLLKLKPLVFIACLVPAGMLSWNAYQVVNGKGLTDLGADPVRALEIRTGLWTLRFLAITLAITPLRQTFQLGALVRYRRMFGLFTFFYACLHLSTWVGLDWFFDVSAMAKEVVKHKYIFAGMATFLLLVPLALTSTTGWVRRLGGARWARLHRLIYLAAITGTVHYLWAVKKDTIFPLAYLATFLVLLGYRAVQLLRHRRAGARGDRRQRTDVPRRAATS